MARTAALGCLLLTLVVAMTGCAPSQPATTSFAADEHVKRLNALFRKHADLVSAEKFDNDAFIKEADPIVGALQPLLDKDGYLPMSPNVKSDLYTAAGEFQTACRSKSNNWALLMGNGVLEEIRKKPETVKDK